MLYFARHFDFTARLRLYMPHRHGLYSALPSTGTIPREGFPSMRFGMLSFVRKLSSSLIEPEDVPRALDIERHLEQAVKRFLYSMQQFDETMQQIVVEHKHDSMGFGRWAHLFKGECLADSLLNYLGIVVDDVAIVISLTLQFRSNRDDSMGGIKHAWLQNQANELAPVGGLLTELEQPGSWWSDLFKTKAGMRQLVVHNQHLVNFHLSTLPGQEPLVKGFLQGPRGVTDGVLSQDFLAVLKEALLGLFDWLDKIEQTLRLHIGESASVVGENASEFAFPIGVPMGTTMLHPCYFLLPMCDGSDPLPWSFDVYQGETGIVLRPKRPAI